VVLYLRFSVRKNEGSQKNKYTILGGGSRGEPTTGLSLNVMGARDNFYIVGSGVPVGGDSQSQGKDGSERKQGKSIGRGDQGSLGAICWEMGKRGCQLQRKSRRGPPNLLETSPIPDDTLGKRKKTWGK